MLSSVTSGLENHLILTKLVSEQPIIVNLSNFGIKLTGF